LSATKFCCSVAGPDHPDTPHILESRINNWNISAQKLLKQGGRMTEEDEAFNDIERQAKQRKEAVKATLTNNAVIDREDRAYKSGMELCA
jgi:hypothetical protein